MLPPFSRSPVSSASRDNFLRSWLAQSASGGEKQGCQGDSVKMQRLRVINPATWAMANNDLRLTSLISQMLASWTLQTTTTANSG